MKLSLDYSNPLTKEQEVLNQILKQYPITFENVRSCGSFSSATANFNSFSAVGYSERQSTELKTMLKAQICAAANVLELAGTPINFLLSSNENDSPTKAIESINRHFITSAPDVDYAIKELERMGVDTSHIKTYRDELVARGERLTKNKLAEFVFPARSNTVIVPKEAPKEEGAKRPAKRTEPIKMTDLVTKYTAQRSGQDAQLIMQSFKEMGVDEKVYNTLPIASKYNSLTLFCLYASEEEVQALIK